MIRMMMFIVAVLCFQISGAHAADEVPITEVKMLAGTWSGYIKNDRGGRIDRLTMNVTEDGTYTITGQNVDAGAGGTISVSDGKAGYRGRQSTGTVKYFKDGTLRFEGGGSRGSGFSEWERKK